MGLKIRLARAGAKKRPYYHIVIADSRSPRDGRFIEKRGQLQPDAAGRTRGPRPPAGRAHPALAVRRARWRPTAWRSSSARPALAPMPVWNEQPMQSAPKKKAQERAKAAAAGCRRRPASAGAAAS